MFHAPKYEVIAMGAVVDGAERGRGVLGELISGFPGLLGRQPSLMHSEARSL
jgi:hypothetical protein